MDRRLTDKTLRTLAENVRFLANTTSLTGPARGGLIAAQERKAHPGEDNLGDAMRHAETSRRVAQDVDPRTARLGGYAVEALGMTKKYLSQLTGLAEPEKDIWAATRMDIYNNTVGREAAARGEGVDPARLQTRLIPR